MIGTKFNKPLEADTLHRTVMRTVTREVEKKEPVYGENGILIEYKTSIETVTEEVPEQETYDNPASNTMTKYRIAAQWCSANKAVIEDKGSYYEVVELPEPTAEERAATELAKARAARAAAVSAITVEVDGMIFDGNEVAQERMARAVTMSESMDETTEWVLHDNTVAIVTAAQLKQACRLAGKIQTGLWVVPYKE